MRDWETPISCGTYWEVPMEAKVSCSGNEGYDRGKSP